MFNEQKLPGVPWGEKVSELADARAALERTIAGDVLGAVLAGYTIHLARPGGERHLVAHAIDGDLWPEIIQTSDVARMLHALDRTFRFHSRRGSGQAGEPDVPRNGER
jgi:hypothetical protein